MKHPDCRIESCTHDAPTGSCRSYHNGYNRGHAEGYARAKAEIVAFLLRHEKVAIKRTGGASERSIALGQFADLIDRGEHVPRGEKK